MLQEVDAAVVSLLQRELKVDHEVVFGAEPADKKGTTIRLNLFDVRENLRMRDETPMRLPASDDSATLKKLPPVRVDMSYLVTVEGESELKAHEMMGELLRLFYRNSRIPREHLTDALLRDGNDSLYLSVAQFDHKSHDRPEAIFLAMGIPMRPAIWLTVTAAFDVYEPEPVKRVRQVLIGVGIIGPDGKAPPLDVVSKQLAVCGSLKTAGEHAEPLPDAHVSIPGTGFHSKSNEAGIFFLVDVPAGGHTLEIEKDGYKKVTKNFVCPPRGRVDLVQVLDLTLEPLTDTVASPNRSVRSIPTVSISGTLSFTDGGVANAVVIRCGEKRTVTDSMGQYRLDGLPVNYGPLIAEVTGIGDVPIKLESGQAKVIRPSEAIKAEPVIAGKVGKK